MLIRRASDRGQTRTDWLESYHTFSFGEYFNPQAMGFSDLRVINEDFINPASGFPFHSHQDMEIITYVLEGEVAHKDSMGNNTVIRAGCMQRMTAGTGITHSEWNPSSSDRLHLLQIWVRPAEKGLAPSYQEQVVNAFDNAGETLILLASPDGLENTLKVHQDLNLYRVMPNSQNTVAFVPIENRAFWLQVVRGELVCNDIALSAGDGIGFENPDLITIETHLDSVEALLFDMKL